ncbi:MAG: RagB/SusD family nutrient uptake outer membrane protein [Flavobacteriales bacterium]|nr:MAG: RagB/SusD family nutrient uptake outer membrane protein [Flavobacteriales bacterium]|tara:strand:- start:3107 stop:4699 length:1593 start_codon:yes stop_codon:yes gene_type:complete
MKTINKIILAIGLIGITYSCTDLEEDLIGDLTSDFSVEGISTGGSGGGGDALTGVFNAVRNAGTANHGGYFSVQSVSSDEMAVTQKGGDWYDGGVWLDVHRHTFTPANGPITGTWSQQYGSIGQVNNAITNGGLDATQMAQAKVVRAYLHWRLMDLYGNVIIADGSGSSSQSSRSTVFNWVEGELLSALGMGSSFDLSKLSNSALGTNDVKYRINQYSALGILAKVYLNAEVYTGTERYSDAAAAAGHIIDNGPYTLSDSSVSVPNLGKRPSVASDPATLNGYAAIFASNNENNPEIIWSVEYDEATAGGMNFHHMSLHYASQYTWNFEAQPWNGYVALEEFVNSYEAGDARRKANFITGPQLDYGGNALVDLASDSPTPEIVYSIGINELEPNAARTGGFRLGKFSFKQFARPDLDNDYPIVRLGDVHLVHAEATARAAGNWALALPEVNAIRARAGVSALSSITAEGFLAERGREMFQEATRRTDLIRFGKWNSSWWEKTNSDSFRSIFPIPTEQLTANPSLQQNSGY